MAKLVSPQNSTPHRFFRSLYCQVIVGIILGVLLGAFYPALADR